ncbi:MAG: FG-GAP repeat domain-containing protein, partial [bacterium]
PALKSIAFLTLLIAFQLPVNSLISGEALQLIQIDPAKSGLDFIYFDGSRGRFDLPEIMGGGMAVADFNNDGLLDLFFCQGGPITSDELKPGQPNADPHCQFYQNLGEMQFKRLEIPSSPGPSYAMGAWPADFNHDGKIDLLVTGWRDWRLYQNLGDWKFKDVTRQLPGKPPAWSTAAVWADFNRDGHPDLFVGGYLDYDAAKAPFCAAPDGRRDYCGPEDFPAVPDRLYFGDGGGKFTDVTAQSGLTKADPARALGVIAFDCNADNLLDLFVANDGTANHLWIQNANGQFTEEAVSRQVAFAAGGEPLAGMGVAALHFNQQNSIGLLVTNFHGRGTVLFESIRGGVFADRSTTRGLQQATRNFNGFGMIAEDLDGDGLPEVVQANGHVLSRERLGTPLKMPISMLSVDRQGNFLPVPAKCNPVSDMKMLGRGLLAADLDNDGKTDLIATRLDGPPVLLKNRSNVAMPQKSSSGNRLKISGGSYLSGYAPK